MEKLNEKKHHYLNSQGWLRYVNFTHLASLNILVQQFLSDLNEEQLLRRMGLFLANSGSDTSSSHSEGPDGAFMDIQWSLTLQSLTLP